MRRKENPFSNLFFNILLPVLVLNYGESWFPQWGALPPLILALSFPIFYGLRDYLSNKNKNIISVLGVINVLLSGGFALFTLEGIWFVVKEAAFPMALALMFFISNWRKTPIMKWVVHRSGMFNIDLIQSLLDSQEKIKKYDQALVQSTYHLGYCMIMSAVLNFLVAFKIFVLDAASTPTTSSALNNQIADMTWISFLVIGLPLSIVSGISLFWLINQVKKITKLNMEQIMNSGVSSGNSDQ